MAVRQILKIGHPLLSQKAEPVENIDDGIRQVVEDMIETMHAAPGIGLSAPQVNVGKRIITIDISIGENKEDMIVLINPELISKEGKVVGEEGCLSVPEVFEKVARPQKVTVKGLDLSGKEQVLEAENLLARTVCHEIDHLDGRLFIDWLSPLKRSLIKKRFKRQAEKSEK